MPVIDRRPLAGDAVVGPTVGRIQHSQQLLPAHRLSPIFGLYGFQPALPNGHHHRGQRRRGAIVQVKDLPPRLIVHQGQPVADRRRENRRPGHIDVVGGNDRVDNPLVHRPRRARLADHKNRFLIRAQFFARQRVDPVGVTPVKVFDRLHQIKFALRSVDDRYLDRIIWLSHVARRRIISTKNPPQRTGQGG